MRFIYLILFFCFLFRSALSDELYDAEINLVKNACKNNEFSSKLIDNLDIEKFIKSEIENDYVFVSLDECLDIALKNNFDIQISNHDYKYYNYDYQNALTKFLPILSFNSYITDYHGQILIGEVLSDNLHETAISASFEARHNLTEGGKEIFEAKAKKYFAKSRHHNYNYTKSQVLYLTVKYYYEMLEAKINIEIYLRNLIERNAQLKLATNLKIVGFGDNFDVIRSKTESAQAQVNLLNALNAFRKSQSQLANLMGIDTKTALMPFERTVEPFHLIEDDKKLEDFFELALKNRQDLKNYKDLINYNRQIRNVYLTDFMPKPYITYHQEWQGTIDHTIRPNYQLGAYLDWIPGENTVFGTITKLKMQKEKIKHSILTFQNKLRLIQEEIINAYSTSQFNKRIMETARKRVDYSLESIQLAMYRFNNGQGILLDVIQAQSEMTLSRVEYVNSIIRYNVSQAELLYNTGTITKEILVENYKP